WVPIARRLVIGGSPLDVEDAVGRDSTGAGEDALRGGNGSIRAQIIPKGEDGVGERRDGQAGVGKIVVGAGKLDVAVGAEGGAGEALGVDRVGERKADGRSDI